MYAVSVTFKIKHGAMDAFLPLMHANAKTSLQSEPGCHQFDVATDPAKPDEVFLYELYDDRGAFEQHLASPHFKAFDTAVADMIADKTVATWESVVQ